MIFTTNGVSARKKIEKMKLRRERFNLETFKYLSLPKPIFNFPDNQMDKVPLLKIVKKIEKKIHLIKLTTIFTHYSHCLNIDHKKTYEAVITACRPINNISVKKILSFEIPSSTDWALHKGKNFHPNYFIDISTTLNEKLKLIKYYKKELRNYPHSRSFTGIKSLASFRGTSCGVKFAEGFYLNRLIE